MNRDTMIQAIKQALHNRTYGYIDKDTFSFEFGEGMFADEDRDGFFYHVECSLLNEKEWIFQKWYEDEVLDAQLPLAEQNYIIAVVKELL